MTDLLTTPLNLGPIRLRNRLAHVSMTTVTTPAGRVTDALVNYHASRAKGGVALTISEPIGTMPRHGALPRTQAWSDADADGFKRWAAAVADQGALLLGQVQDAGRGHHYEGRLQDAIGASVLPDDLSWSVPRALTTEEIRIYVEGVATSAARLHRWGFAGVELSCGHGHLFHQFLSPWMNRRTDAYGGTVENRTRFVAEMVAAIRALCGPSFLIGLKLPGNDGLPGSIDDAEAFSITQTLCTATPPDYVSYAWGSHARTLEMHVPDRFGPRLAYMDRIRALKPALERQPSNGLGERDGAPPPPTRIPLMAIGRITDPAEAEAILRADDADLIGLGRALVADPAFLNKSAAGRAHDIRYCLSCNTCWGTIVQDHKTIACVNNPRVTQQDEADFTPAKAATPHRVVIVGAGPAGLEAAWVAAARGHHVTVFGRGPEPGGKTLFRAPLPGGETITSIPDYQVPRAVRAGARLLLGREATIDDILAEQPETVVLATGARMIPPDWLPEEWQDAVPGLREAMAALPKHGTQPGTAVIIDTDHSEAVYAAALHLHATFDRCVIVTPRDTIGQGLHMMVRQSMLRRIAQAGVEIVAYHEPIWTDAALEGALEVENIHTGNRRTIEDVAFLSYATARAPELWLEPGLRAAGIPVIRAGDAIVAGELLAATATGHDAGLRA